MSSNSKIKEKIKFVEYNLAPPADWRITRLSEISNIRFSNVDKKGKRGEYPVKLCNYMDVYANEYITSKLNFMEATASSDEIAKFLVEEGDVIVTKDSETPDDIGIPAAVAEKIPNLVCGYHLAQIKPNAALVNSIFLAKQIGHDRIARHFSRLANGSTRYGLSTASFENVEIWLPPFPEQNKIAKILTTVDNLIEKTEALIAKYEAIKQGMMHDLFTRGVDENGRLRPSCKSYPGDWKTAPLNEISNIRFSNVDKKRKRGESPVKLCNYMDVYANDYITSELDFMEATASSEEIAKFLVEKDDVIVTKDSETPDDIGIPATAAEKIPNLVCGYHLAQIKPDHDQVDSIFLAKQIEHDRIARYFSRLANGSTRYGLSTASFENAKIFLPQMCEQIKIAEIIKKLDKHILENTNLLKKYHQIKTALMQDLLTGKVRVPPDEETEAHV
jgi:type I restriction enzyme S subunit